MKKMIVAFCFLLSAAMVCSQNIELEIVPDKAPELDQDIMLKIFITNKTGKPITVFDPKFCQPSWNVFKEEFNATLNGEKLNLREFRDGADGRFSVKNIVTLAPNQKMYFSTKHITPKVGGHYKITYMHSQSPNYVNPNFAKDQVAIDKSKTVYTFNAKTTYEFDVKQSEYKETKNTVNMTYEEFVQKSSNINEWKKYTKENLKDAFADPDNTYQLVLNCSQLDFNSVNNISKLKNLKVLRLFDYKFDRFPDNIAQLKLYSLSISITNGKLNFPSELYSMNSLRTLNVSINNSSLDLMKLCNLENLESLSLGGCRISSLPDSFGRLSNLKNLDLSGNDLTMLPNSFSNLKKLEVLYLNNNKLTSVANISSPKLKELSVDFNQVTAITDEVKNMPNIENISFAVNKIKTVTPQIGSLKKLKDLNLQNNEYTEIPTQIKDCEMLETLNLGYSPLVYLPEGISENLSIKTMLLVDCKDLKKNKDYKIIEKRLGSGKFRHVMLKHKSR